MKKVILTFLITYLISFCLLEAFFKMLQERESYTDLEQTKILQEHVRDRFKLFLEVPISVGLMGSDYLSDTGLKNKSYGEYFNKVITFNKDILGINLLDAQGRIIGVFPAEKNRFTLGKISQNAPYFQESFSKHEPFWISGPFNLYQGKPGFGAYIPITKNELLLGWVAVVITTELFDQKFTLDQFLETYHLNIIDSKTGNRYYSSGIETEQDEKKYESTVKVFGRDIIIMSWRKEASPFTTPWYWKALFCFFLSFVGAMLMKLNIKNKEAKTQLKDISTLLQMTSSEALSKLIDIQDDNYKLELGKNISYLANLLEQIDLLQTMAEDQETIKNHRQDFFPLFEDELNRLSDALIKKNIQMKYSKEELQDVSIPINSWLLQHTILHHCLSYGILYAGNSGQIKVGHTKNEHTQLIYFHLSFVPQKKLLADSAHFERRLDVARRALKIYQGDLFIDHENSDGMKIKIILPI